MNKITQPEPKAERKHSRTLNMQRKFLLGIGAILFFFCIACACLVYWHERYLLQETAYAKSEIVMAAVEAGRSYVRDVLRPKMFEILGADAFVLEAMSTSYVGRAVMERFNNELPAYRYRRAAINARNPASEANLMEVEMIRYFHEHNNQNEWHGIVKRDGVAQFVRFHPVVFVDSCMHCHGRPEAAPAALLELYSRDRGFGHQPGDLAGVVGVGIPVDVALAKSREMALNVLWVGFLAVLLLFVVISSYFNRVVVHNLKDLLNIFRQGLRDEVDGESPDTLIAPEDIDNLNDAAHRMVLQLNTTRRDLHQHMENLEQIVDDRTTALKRSEERLRQQVRERNRELKTLNILAELTTRSQTIADILPAVLDQTLGLIQAEGAAVYLLLRDPDRLELCYRKGAEELAPGLAVDAARCDLMFEDDAKDLPTSLGEAACGHMSLVGGETGSFLNVPLCCRGQVLGVMTFTGVELEEIGSDLHELLFSIGRQIGIALESLQNLEQLLRSKDLLQSVFDGITDVVVYLDRESRIRMVNRAYLTLSNKRLDQVLGLRCREVTDPTLCPCSECGLDRVLADGRPAVEEVRNSRGEIYHVHFYPVTGDQGEVTGVIRYAREVTDQRRVEQRIQQADKMVSLGQLAAGIAHEINNPLGVILCYTDLLRRQLVDFPAGLKDLATVEKHALNCRRIVSDLLKFARSQQTSRQLIALNRSIEEVVQMVAQQFRRQRIQVELDPAGNLPLINLDVNKMKQVYLNLLMNSCQAIDGHGRIVIATHYLQDQQAVELSFWDNGKGIAPEIIEKIYDPFFSTKATGEGTGLGLSVSYGIVQDHGGEILVESEPGHWTRFRIRLPVDERERLHA